MPTSTEIRQQFIDFFCKKHGHTFVPSSPVVPLDDPTLLFTNAGMNQFKDVFLGTGTRPYKRAADTQKCIRASGKHNDLEDVGRDTYHHTFFEMLGNWSFGDYYKAEAIRWAWELLTKEWGLDKSRLHATVFGGDKEFGLEADEDAFKLWTSETDIDPSHVHRFGKKDNFWMMGETGPCGPCSEIHIDRTPDKSGAKLVNAGDARVMEIWNLVFIQYNRDDSGKLHLLPAKHVDTGMGFERICAVLQKKDSNYDTDVFTPIIAKISELTSKTYGGTLSDPVDVAFRVVADHLRMAAFAIADGAKPDNKGRGSVVRSVLRRAVRFVWQQFKVYQPFIHQLVDTLVRQMGDVFPELKVKKHVILREIHFEEAGFIHTIHQGLDLYEEARLRARQAGKRISGEDVFHLHTTYGFPPDLTRQMAREAGFTIDEKRYHELLTEHEEKSRGKVVGGQVALSISGGLPATDDRAKWSTQTCEAEIVGCWRETGEYLTDGPVPADQRSGLLVDSTCFYAEQGGQVGDKGFIRTATGLFEVDHTQRAGDAVVHVGSVARGTINIHQAAQLEVSSEREFTRKNHTATHLLHWALHCVLGDHVEQRGSKVKPDEFTFDFSHTGPLTDAEKAEVERLVNERVYADLPVTWRELPIAEAKKLEGVKAFFGDKYGDTVRVVEISDPSLAGRASDGVSSDPSLARRANESVFSREFCGGTHLDHTGQIGFFKIVGEEAVGKGVRRLTCVTAKEAVKAVQAEDAVLTALTNRFRCRPTELPAKVEALEEQIKRLQQQLKKGASTDLAGAADKLLAAAVDIGGAKVIVGEMPAGPDEQIRAQIDRIKQTTGSAVVVVGWTDEGKVGLTAAATDDLVKRGIHAGKLVGEVAKIVGGGGGGKPTMAQAGGKEPAKLASALETARKLIEVQLKK